MLTTQTHGTISELSPLAWDALVGDRDPFVEHGFLLALERSGSVGEGSGWTPIHLSAWDGDCLVGALPSYLKEHSLGEYIFDWAWADASRRLGAPYYPKLVSMVPFTPATGRRLLVHPDADFQAVSALLVDGARALAEANRCSSVHLLFLTEAEQAIAQHRGLLARLSLQFHFHNRGYASFEDFLGTCRAPARKQIRRERQKVAQSGLTIETKLGSDLSDEEWSVIGGFYQRTCAKRGSHAYLQPAFFAEVRDRLAHRVVTAFAYDGARPVAATLNFEKGPHLYGRYWGSHRDYELLHFELCYYRLIDRAIANRLTRLEAGAQGVHKVRRGFAPSLIHSAHWLANPILDKAVAEFLPREARAVRAECASLEADLPFRRGERQDGGRTLVR